MTQSLAWIAIGMTAVFVSLVATIVTRRFLADRRRARERRLRPAIEVALGDHLAAEEPRPQATHPAARDLLRAVALESMAELRGRERDRLVALLERTGIVAATAAELGSRRRRVRRAAAEALRQIGSAESLLSLEIGLQDPDLDTALTCAAAIAELSGEEPIVEVLALADDAASARPGAVAAILVALGRRHPAAIGEALRPCSSIELRRLAAAVAGEMRLAEHVRALREALAAADDELATRAARGLGAIGDGGAVEPLLDAVENRERAWFLRLAATDALGELGDPRAIPPLERELRDEGWALQAKAARALRQLGAAGEAALRRALSSPEEAAREHARVALER